LACARSEASVSQRVVNHRVQCKQHPPPQERRKPSELSLKRLVDSTNQGRLQIELQQTLGHDRPRSPIQAESRRGQLVSATESTLEHHGYVYLRRQGLLSGCEPLLPVQGHRQHFLQPERILQELQCGPQDQEQCPCLNGSWQRQARLASRCQAPGLLGRHPSRVSYPIVTFLWAVVSFLWVVIPS
jgi:hypothetical protein